MKIILSVFFLFFFSLGNAQFGIQQPIQNSPGKIHREKIADWKEIVSERKINSSAYLKEDSTVVYFYSREAVNFLNGGKELEPVSTLPHVDITGWHANRQKNPFSVLKNGSISTLGFGFSEANSINGILNDFNVNEVILQSDTLVFKNYLPHIDKFLQFRNNGIKYSYVIQNPIDLSSDFVIEEFLTLKDETYSVYQHISDSDLPGFIQILNANKEVVFSISPLWCYDAAGNTIVGNYLLEKISSTVYKLKMTVPQNYFNQSGIMYPITIDPLITGPTSTWSGGTMPSCFAPNFNHDSIQITVPGQITVTGILVTSNYYANPFTTTVMADGQMTFSTSCATSTNFTVAPPTGNTAGTAFLEDFNLNNPLMCCHPQSCNPYTFYLTMNLARSSNGTACNSTYLYYDPTSIWPFSAYIEGRTIESYSSQAYIPNSTLCSNDCDFQLVTYSRYGVPPFTVTHPWLATPYTSGTLSGCNSAYTIQTVNLTIPNCPVYCDTTSNLTVPPPTVTDACGNTVGSWPILSLNLKPVSNVSASSDTLFVCSDVPANLNLSSCLPSANVFWMGHGNTGTGTNIIDSNTFNSSIQFDTITYEAFSELNGCVGDTSEFLILIEPPTILDFSVHSTPIFILDNVTFDDILQTPGVIDFWRWTVDGNFVSSDSIAQFTWSSPGEYQVCLEVNSTNGCSDTICKNITVLPLEIVLPNVITPNGDAQNDFLSFQYLTYFESNNLTVYNRWGNPIFSKENYQNDWSGEDFSEGVYYFVLRVEEKEYSGNFHLFR